MKQKIHKTIKRIFQPSLIALSFILSSNIAQANTFKKLTFNKNTLNKNFSYKGQIVGGERWNDINGENTLIISQQLIKSADNTTDELFAYHYILKNGKTNLLWQHHDSVLSPCDRGEGIIHTDVKDTDNNGIAENSFIYSIEGHCDVSPSSFFLIMHEGKKEYIIRNVYYFSSQSNKFIEKSDIDKDLRVAHKPVYVSTMALWNKYVVKKYLNNSLGIINETYLPGKYPDASRKLLKKSEIKDKKQAQEMINEIYARHGYVFKNNSISDSFQKSNWYIPIYSSVDNFFTKVEEKNINLLSAFK